jgi:hypothetical protein
VDSWMWILIAVAAAIVLVLVVMLVVSRVRRNRRTARLRDRFGPEYETAVHRFGRNEGEAYLEGVLREHASRRIRDVSPDERDGALESWQAIQSSFVDAPVTAVREADQLVFGVLRERGYPLETVDARASALSVDQPELANRYRSAHASLASAESSGETDVAVLRDALLTYRELLRELVGAPAVQGRLTTQSGTDGTESTAEPAGAEPPPQHAMASSRRAAGDERDDLYDRSDDEEESWRSTPTDRT